MTPPPIRYPLPTLILVILLGVVAWWGRGWVDVVGAAVRAGIDRVVSGPPVPSSDEPMQHDGGIVRKVLLLRDGVEATDIPDGDPVETIRRRIFADVYDVWPLRGEPTHYRIGNRRPIGWVPAGDVLPWDTRIVLIPGSENIPLGSGPRDSAPTEIGVDDTPIPVISWDAEARAVRVALWDPGAPWERVERVGWVPIDGIEVECRALLSRAELLELLRRSVDASPGEMEGLRVMAVLGTLGAGETLREDQVERIRRFIPGAADWTIWQDEEPLADRLGRLNDEWRADAAWSGIEYRAVPLEDLPEADDAG